MRFLKLLDENLERWFIAAAMASMVIFIGLQVFMRYALQNSLVWSEEFVRWTFIWTIWIGIAYAFKTRQHIRITVVVDLFSDLRKTQINIAIQIVMLLFFLWIGYLGYEQVTKPFILRQTSVVMSWPIIGGQVGQGWMYATLPIGSALSAYRLLQNILEDLKNIRNMKGQEQ